MNSKPKIFLDLEETVIDSWQSGLLVNSHKVRDFLADQQVSNVTIFSFAVWNDEDQKTFAKEHQRSLQKALDTHVAECPTVQDFMQADTRLTGVHWHGDVTEFITLRGKMGAFVNWCKLHHPNHNCVLVDDVVDNVDIVNRDTGTTIRFINVGSLK